jgi:hypothetical protein
MDLQNALECITNSNSINKLDANIQLSNNITSGDNIYWSKFGKLYISSDLDYNGNRYYIDKISEFNGDLTLNAVNINSLQGDLKSLKTGDYTSVVNFEADTSIEELTFHTACLIKNGSNPSIAKANIQEYMQEHLIGQTDDVNLEGFLSNATNISRLASSDTTEHFMSLGYLTVDNNTNENWAHVSIENQSVGVSDHKYVVPADFYNNLIFYCTEDGFVLDYINNSKINDDENYYDIVIPQSSALKEYMPEFPELPVFLGDYCFAGIGSKPESEKDRHLYLTFDDKFIFNKDSEAVEQEDGTIIESSESSKPFTENTFLARPKAIQVVHINIPERRPEDDLDIQNLYFSDFFTTCVKTKTTTTENIDTTFEIDEEAFNSYKNQLLAMVDGNPENLIFGSQYEDIEAYIDVDN